MINELVHLMMVLQFVHGRTDGRTDGLHTLAVVKSLPRLKMCTLYQRIDFNWKTVCKGSFQEKLLGETLKHLTHLRN